MNAAFLIIPLILIRYGLLGAISKEALQRAAHFPPLIGKEKTAFWVYQISVLCMLIYFFFLQVVTDSVLFYIGLSVYAAGLLLCIFSMSNFAKPKDNGINTKGLYRLSRHPIYVSYLVYFLGCMLLTRSLIVLSLVVIHQVSVHFIILCEERWCIQTFGDEYLTYMKKVRRYL